MARELLTHILGAEPGIRVIGTAASGEEAIAKVRELRPRIVTMDIVMPRMSGFEACRRIMETVPTPIIAMTANRDPHEVEVSFQALDAGALTCIQKPRGGEGQSDDLAARELVEAVKALADVRVVRRYPRCRKVQVAPAPKEDLPRNIKVIAIGASTGGPAALQKLLSRLPGDLPVPVLIVQHISSGFTEGFARWLEATTQFPVHAAVDGEPLLPGRAYLAPEGMHMGVDREGRIALADGSPEHSLRPSASYLLRSVCRVFGRDAVGVLLSGMGRDGAAELKLMRDHHAVTFVQDEESSTVFGMPAEAIRIGAAEYILPPEAIAALITDLTAPLTLQEADRTASIQKQRSHDSPDPGETREQDFR